MNRYQILYEENDDPEQGVYAISIVDSPANKMDVIAMSEEESFIKLKENPSIQQTLTGVVLIPDQVIIRKNPETLELYEITFPQETIVNLSRDFFRKGNQNMSTYNHLDNQWLSGVTVVESWLISHESVDKAFALGFKDLPIGTWMITMKLSDENWAKYVETGEVRGFSIDAYLPNRKLIMSENEPTININLKEEKMNLLKDFMTLLSKHSIKLASVDVNGVMYSADAFQVGNIVYQDEQGQMVPVVNATFDAEGNTIVTDETGTIVSVTPIEVQDAEPQVEIEMEMLEPEVVGEVEIITDSIDEEITKDVAEIDVQALMDKVLELEKIIQTITEQKNTVLAENEALKAMPNDTRLKAEVLSKVKETTTQALSRIANL